MNFRTSISRSEWDTDATYSSKVASMKRMSGHASNWFALSRSLGDYGGADARNVHDLAMSATMFPETATASMPELAVAKNRADMYSMLVDPYVDTRVMGGVVVAAQEAAERLSVESDGFYKALAGAKAMTPDDVRASYNGVAPSDAFNDAISDFYRRRV